MELYNVRNIARQGIERGDPGEKNMPRMVKFRKQQFPIKAQIRSLRMVTVTSDFLSMLNGKWSSEKFQDEQFNEKFGVAFSDGDICIFRCNINVFHKLLEKKQCKK
jgi:hypothetical protein